MTMQLSSNDTSAAAVPESATPERPLYNGVSVRSLQRHEIPTVCEMYVENDEWTTIPSVDFHLALFDAYPDGWLGAVIDNEVVGTMFFAKFPGGDGFGGYFFVKRDFRSKGIGKRLQDACLANFSGTNFGINAMEHRVASNIRSGYSVVSFRILAFSGVVDRTLALQRVSELQSSDVILSEIREPPEELLEYDGAINAARRDAMVKQYTQLTQSRTVIAERRGKIVGYGTLHKCYSGYQISPLYADDVYVAELIFNSLAARILSGEELCYTAPALNAAAVSLAESHRLPLLYATVRQYTQKEVTLPLHKVYSIATEDGSFA